MANSNVELVQALDKIRLNNLYVHDGELREAVFSTLNLSTRKVYLVETLAVINALVDRGTMLLYGGHGGGKTTLAKYLGQIFYKLSKDEIEDCILRGHPQLTEEKILGSLDIAQLTRAKELNDDKKVDVIWNTFVDSSWKIIDELNRLSPYAQNILLSLLAESSVKYHNESKRLPNFSLYATMNPKDEGNFMMSLPFLDRFALALPITMPDYESLSTIGRKDKSSKQDDLSNYLKGFDLKSVQDEIKALPYSDDAELFINVIISEYRICDRLPKEANDKITVDNALCKGCHYNAPLKACNKIVHPLSVRVKEDLYRYGKAIAWFLGDNIVNVNHIKILAPYMIWHRSSVSNEYTKQLREKIQSKRVDEDVFYLNIALEATKQIIDIIYNEFEGLKKILKEFEKVKKGKLSQEEFDNFIGNLHLSNENFLIVKKEIIPILLSEYKPVYPEIIAFNKKIFEAVTIEGLNSIESELAFRYDIPNRQFLADLIDKKNKQLIVERYNEEIFTIPYNPNFLLNLQSECVDLFLLLNSRYKLDFKPALNLEEDISDGGMGYQLSMRRVNSIKGGFDLKFRYRGDHKNSIYNFLADKNARQV